MFLTRLVSQKRWVSEAKATSCFCVARLNVSNSITSFACWQVFFWTSCIVRQLVQEIQTLFSDISLKRFMCTLLATVAAPIYYYFLSCGDFSHPVLRTGSPITASDWAFLAWCTASRNFLADLGLKIKVLGKIFLTQEISLSSGTVHLTSITSLWVVSMMPTIQKNSCSI